MIRSLSTLDSFHECSKLVQNALLHLEKFYKKQPRFYDSEIDSIVVLGVIEPNYLTKFEKCSKHQKFYSLSNNTESHDVFPLICETNIDATPVYDAIKDEVLENGCLTYNIEEHTGLLLFYVRFLPDSKITKKGIDFWIKSWKDLDLSYKSLITVSLGLRALVEFDPIIYKGVINDHVQMLLKHQKSNGSFYVKKGREYEETAHCIIALSEVLEPTDKIFQKSTKFLRKELEQMLSSKYLFRETIALIVTALFILGDGPKISRTQCKLQQKKLTLQIRNLKNQNRFQSKIMSDNWGLAVFQVSLLEAFLKKWLIENNHKKIEELKNAKFGVLLDDVKKYLKASNIQFEQQYFSILIGQRDFRNHIIHELYNPTDNEIKKIIEINSEFMNYLNQITS